MEKTSDYTSSFEQIPALKNALNNRKLQETKKVVKPLPETKDLVFL